MLKYITVLTTLLCAAVQAYAGVKIDHWIAPTGANVFFIETRVLPILDIQIDFAAGGVHVPQSKAGLAGLTRGLLAAGAAGAARVRDAHGPAAGAGQDSGAAATP